VKILVAGMVAGDPHQGGATWAVLQYVLGLERLGHDVVLVEPVRELAPEVVEYFESLRLRRGALLRAGSSQTVGMSYEDLRSFDPDLLLNISGLLREPELVRAVRTRVFMDLDPVFVQIWHAQGADFGLDDHTHHVTVGTRLESTRIPLDRRWIPTFPPVVLEHWPYSDELEHDAFTTVGHWRSYGSVEWGSVVYGQRAHAVRRLLELPALTQESLLPALAIHPGERADLEALSERGWQLADPLLVAGTPDAYRRFVSGSKGELGLTKAGYLDSRCGWFSDRSACYLASGRPVVTGDTGFSEALPTGDGLVAFDDARGAAAAIGRIVEDYAYHRQAARALAEEHLDSDRVLGRLLEAVL